MGEDLTRDRRIPKPVRRLLIVAAVVTTIGGALKVISDLRPPTPTPVACETLATPKDAQSLTRLHERLPEVRYTFPKEFDLWARGKPASISSVAIAVSPGLQELEKHLQGKSSARGKRAIYFVHAPGGSGKTPLVSHLRNTYSLAYVNLTDLNKQLMQGNSQWAERAVELEIMGKEVSWQPKLLPNALQGGLEEFIKKLSGEKVDFAHGLLVDSIDEVHPDSALAILNALAEYSTNNPNRVLVVAGRGEAFREYMVQNEFRYVQEVRLPNVYFGNPTLLKWYVDDYMEFKKDESVNPAQRAKDLRDGLERLTKTHPFTRHFLYPGSLGNFAIENVRYTDESGQRLEALMFQSLIERNKKTHHRPVKDDAVVWSMYKNALVQIARRYKPDADGVFLVGPQDTVCVTDGQSRALVNVGRVLMRSGLVDLNPVNVQYLEFLFWPQTLHAFLAKGSVE